MGAAILKRLIAFEEYISRCLKTRKQYYWIFRLWLRQGSGAYRQYPTKRRRAISEAFLAKKRPFKSQWGLMPGRHYGGCFMHGKTTDESIPL